MYICLYLLNYYVLSGLFAVTVDCSERCTVQASVYGDSSCSDRRCSSWWHSSAGQLHLAVCLSLCLLVNKTPTQTKFLFGPMCCNCCTYNHSCYT